VSAADEELKDAKIEITADIFGRIMAGLEPPQSSLKQILKFAELYQMHQGSIEEFTIKFQNDMKAKRR
jgi:hypothetical protein